MAQTLEVNRTRDPRRRCSAWPSEFVLRCSILLGRNFSEYVMYVSFALGYHQPQKFNFVYSLNL